MRWVSVGFWKSSNFFGQLASLASIQKFVLSPTFTFSLIFKCALFKTLKGRNTSFIHTVILNTVTRKFVVDFLIISLILVPPLDDVNLFLALFLIKNKKIPGNNQRLKLSFFLSDFLERTYFQFFWCIGQDQIFVTYGQVSPCSHRGTVN